jgi:hypothetical protein
VQIDLFVFEQKQTEGTKVASKLEKLQERASAAWIALDEAIDAEFPIGSRVVVMEHRRMPGTVASTATNGRVLVRAANGKRKRHRKDWRNVRHDRSSAELATSSP